MYDERKVEDVVLALLHLVRALLVDYFDFFLKGRRNGFDDRPHVETWA